ncbi:pectinesterase [Puccinia sorghi]|uniref:Pectinesterase n=1 Tax=Puccinia sorghi TaxID=27349 RepID=A0A0L6VNR9_9BASI|nr:pectinesterase [Puccinia sorghi]
MNNYFLCNHGTVDFIFGRSANTWFEQVSIPILKGSKEPLAGKKLLYVRHNQIALAGKKFILGKVLDSSSLLTTVALYLPPFLLSLRRDGQITFSIYAALKSSRHCITIHLNALFFQRVKKRTPLTFLSSLESYFGAKRMRTRMMSFTYETTRMCSEMMSSTYSGEENGQKINDVALQGIKTKLTREKRKENKKENDGFKPIEVRRMTKRGVSKKGNNILGELNLSTMWLNLNLTRRDKHIQLERKSKHAGQVKIKQSKSNTNSSDGEQSPQGKRKKNKIKRTKNKLYPECHENRAVNEAESNREKVCRVFDDRFPDQIQAVEFPEVAFKGLKGNFAANLKRPRGIGQFETLSML